MDQTPWVTLLEQFGFPVVVSAALGWFIIYTHTEHRKEREIDRGERKEMSLKSAESTDKLADAVTSLQLALNSGGREV